MSNRSFAESIANLKNSPEDLSDIAQPDMRELALLVIDNIAHFESQDSAIAKVQGVLPELYKINPGITLVVKTVGKTYPVEVAHVRIIDMKMVLAILRGVALIPQGCSQSLVDEVEILVYQGTRQK